MIDYSALKDSPTRVSLLKEVFVPIVIIMGPFVICTLLFKALSMQKSLATNITDPILIVSLTIGILYIIIRGIKSRANYIQEGRDNFELFARANNWTYYQLSSNTDLAGEPLLPLVPRFEGSYVVNTLFGIEGEVDDKALRLSSVEAVEAGRIGRLDHRPIISFFTILRVPLRRTTIPKSKGVQSYQDSHYEYYVVPRTVSTKREVENLFKAAGL